MNIKNSVLDYIKYKQLNWYGHVQRMEEERLPRKILEWCPLGRGTKGRPRNSWMLKVTTEMREREIGDLEWVDRDGWKKKIKIKKYSLGTERCENIKNLYTNKEIIIIIIKYPVY